MAAPLTAEVVNAFVDPVLDVIRSYIGIDAQKAQLSITEDIDPPPSLVCTVEMTGRLTGPVTWVFSEDLARLFASKMMAVDALDALGNAVCDEVVSELANIITGNATGILTDAGYEVEILPPRTRGPGLDERKLTEKSLVVSLETSVGVLKVVIGVRVLEAQ